MHNSIRVSLSTKKKNTDSRNFLTLPIPFQTKLKQKLDIKIYFKLEMTKHLFLFYIQSSLSMIYLLDQVDG